jgi:hypothetical protein
VAVAGLWEDWDVTLWIFLFGAVAVVVAVTLCYSRWIKDGEWHPTANGLMRRFRDGNWEHRLMTVEEELDYVDDGAW